MTNQKHSCFGLYVFVWNAACFPKWPWFKCLFQKWKCPFQNVKIQFQNVSLSGLFLSKASSHGLHPNSLKLHPCFTSLVPFLYVFKTLPQRVHGEMEREEKHVGCQLITAGSALSLYGLLMKFVSAHVHCANTVRGTSLPSRQVLFCSLLPL